MSDFVSEFWSWFIIVPTVLGLVFCVVLMVANTTTPKSGEAETMGHVWDEDLREYNNPLPKWWLNMFYITLVFSAVYLLLYPGLGSFAGLLGWTSKDRYDNEVRAAEASFKPLYDAYLATPLDELAGNADAMGTAKRLFSTNCAICHGADARGATGFPNLRDHEWIWGGGDAEIKTTIAAGRTAVMPGWAAVIGPEGVEQVSEYVYAMTRDPLNPSFVAPGKQHYDTVCLACHGPEGKGNPVLGAPDLTDGVWLYGGSLGAIRHSVGQGRIGVMPPFGELLDESRIHLLTAYLNSIRE